MGTLLEIFDNLRPRHSTGNFWEARPMLAVPPNFRFYVDVKRSRSSNSDRTRRKRFWGRWQGCLTKSGNLEMDCGKCAEYLLWVELPPEKIPLPEDEEDAERVGFGLWGESCSILFPRELMGNTGIIGRTDVGKHAIPSFSIVKRPKPNSRSFATDFYTC